MIRLIDPSTYRTVPWKNGGGTATTIALSDAAADPSWRIATAAIPRDGPFSDLAGVTRIFTVIEGPGVHLDFPGVTRTLGRDEPLRFAGAPAPFCRLRGGPATAFNLMTRDGACRGEVAIRHGAGRPEPLPEAELVAVYAVEGDWRIESGGETTLVPAGWTAILSGSPAAAAAGTGARAAVVGLSP